MPARDANNATWYILRYAEDFTPRANADEYGPRMEGSLHYDMQRQVLELRSQSSSTIREPLPGRAVDVDGNIYFISTKTGFLTVRRCDGSEHPVLCEPRLFASSSGMAMDRRGLLYVTDSQAQCIVVVDPDARSIQDRFGHRDLVDPVDIAIGDRHIYVVDRAAGNISLFNFRHSCLNHFIPHYAEGSSQTPKPIAVMIEADGNLLVVDANYPRLLRFATDCRPLPDVELSSYLDETLEWNQLPLEYYAKVIGKSLPPSVVASSSITKRPLSPRFVTQRQLEMHRMLRLLPLRIEQSYPPQGVFLSAVLDSGTPGCLWHRVEVDAELMAGAVLTIETATADDLQGLSPSVLDDANHTAAEYWQAPRRQGRLIPLTPLVSSQLIQSPPGRYLRLKVTLRSDGSWTPRVAAIRVRYPRASYLDLLPPLFRRDPESSQFLERFLALFEGVLTGVEDRYEQFSRQLNPDAVPREMVEWLACLIDLGFDPSWSQEKRRILLSEAIELYRTRGTVRGLERYVEIYTGHRPLIREQFLERPSRPVYVGTPGSVLGCSFALRPARPDVQPEAEAFQSFAHRMMMLVYLDDECDAELVLPVVQRIVSVNKPAHVLFGIRVILANARVALQSNVGIDFVLGDRPVAGTRLSGCTVPGSPTTQANVIGVDTILGQRRPHYVRPIIQGLR